MANNKELNRPEVFKGFRTNPLRIKSSDCKEGAHSPSDAPQTSFQKKTAKRLICPSWMVSTRARTQTQTHTRTHTDTAAEGEGQRAAHTALTHNTENHWKPWQSHRNQATCCFTPFLLSYIYLQSFQTSTADARVDIIKRKLSKNQCNYFELKIFLTKS